MNHPSQRTSKEASSMQRQLLTRIALACVRYLWKHLKTFFLSIISFTSSSVARTSRVSRTTPTWDWSSCPRYWSKWQHTSIISLRLIDVRSSFLSRTYTSAMVVAVDPFPSGSGQCSRRINNFETIFGHWQIHSNPPEEQICFKIRAIPEGANFELMLSTAFSTKPEVNTSFREFSLVTRCSKPFTAVNFNFSLRSASKRKLWAPIFVKLSCNHQKQQL